LRICAKTMVVGDRRWGMAGTTHCQNQSIKNLARIRTVKDLTRLGWPTNKPSYDGALVCPNCNSILKRETINEKDGATRANAAQNILFDDTGGFEIYCESCDAWFHRQSIVVYDYRVVEEQPCEPHFEYNVADLPIKSKSHDPGPFAAAALVASYRNIGGFSGASEVVAFSDKFSWEYRVECPLCKQEPAYHELLDFHHWRYEDPEIGISLCRACHKEVHDYQRASDQSDISPTGDWVDDALARLVKIHRTKRMNKNTQSKSIQNIKLRYNIPFSVGRIKNAHKSFTESCKHITYEPPICRLCGKWWGYPEPAVGPRHDLSDQELRDLAKSVTGMEQ